MSSILNMDQSEVIYTYYECTLDLVLAAVNDVDEGRADGCQVIPPSGRPLVQIEETGQGEGANMGSERESERVLRLG